MWPAARRQKAPPRPRYCRRHLSGAWRSWWCDCSAATRALEEGGLLSWKLSHPGRAEAPAIPIALVLGSAGQAVTNTAEEALEEASTSGAEEEHDEEDDNSVKSKSEERTLR